MKEMLYNKEGVLIYKENGKYIIAWMDGSHVPREWIYEISRENVEKALNSDRDLYKVMGYAYKGKWPSDYDYDAMIYERTGKWPSEESEKIYIQKTKEWGYGSPNSLITNPQKQQYYTEEELKYLLKKVKREYLDDDGNKELDRLLEKLGE